MPGLGFKIKICDRPRFPSPQRNYINPLYWSKSPKNPSSITFETVKNPKCRNLTSPTISTTLLIIPILLTMCGITAPWVARSGGFWPGYHHSNPRYATATSKAVGLTRWEIGSYRPRNIGIGLVVSVGAIPLVQPCFSTEVLESAKHTLGRREDTRGKEVIANKL